MFFSNSISKQNSLLIALLTYFIIIFLFFLYIKTSDVKKFDAFNKTTTIELSILLDKDSKIINKESHKEKSKTIDKVVEKSKSISAKQQNSVKSLFANVKDTSENVIENSVNNVVKSEVASRFKAKFEKERKSEKLSVSTLLNNVKSKASVMPSNESKNSIDPYYSKIYELLAKRWNPSLVGDDLFAKVLVIITNDGKFDFRFLKYSGNEFFDKSLTSFLNEQVNITYPEHDKGSEVKIEVIFKSER
ncbi:MAG: energy transducer TonB [Arcobacter sp.]|uniref:energy transducer TonB n=1 Tax=Arcobacter iocasae TaxID=2906515 RepID=UPI0035D48690